MKPRNCRIAVTGYYAGFCTRQGWVEFSASNHASLRTAFEQAAQQTPLVTKEGTGEVEHEQRKPTALSAPEFSLLSSHIVEELTSAALWANDALTVDPQRVAISFAASKGRLTLSAKEAYLCGVVESTGDWPAVALSRRVGSTGPLLSPVAACATGAHTMALGAQLIQDGYADVALVGALEHGLTDVVLAGYKSLGALSNKGTMRPFDRQRDGFIPAEGIGCLVLEAEDQARARQAPIYGYVTGWSMQADATSMTAMEANGASIARAIEVALRRADYPALDYINAHGTATKLNDVVETRAIKQVFGSSVPISATKPLTGHLLGAAGAVEAVFCLMAMRENYAPPTLNLETSDIECDLDYIPGQGRDMSIKNALSLSYGFGGHCGVLIFERD